MDTGRVLDVSAWETGTDLRGYRCVPADPVALVLVVHGFGEHAGRHAKTMQRWASRHIASFSYDQRNHGNSPGKRATFSRFDDFVDDTIAMRARVAAEHPGRPLFLFGISMGGVVAARSAERNPDGLRGVVLLAPAFAPAEHIPPVVQTILRGLRKIAPNLALTPLSFGALSRDPAVGEAYKADPLTYHGGVPLCSGIELVEAANAAVADAVSYTVPTLILQGDADKIVSPVGATRFAAAANGNRDLTLTSVPGGYHELFNDPGSEPLVEASAEWILARS